MHNLGNFLVQLQLQLYYGVPAEQVLCTRLDWYIQLLQKPFLQKDKPFNSYTINTDEHHIINTFLKFFWIDVHSNYPWSTSYFGSLSYLMSRIKNILWPQRGFYWWLNAGSKGQTQYLVCLLKGPQYQVQKLLQLTLLICRQHSKQLQFLYCCKTKGK